MATVRQQIRSNAVALISLAVALSSLGYNTWRNERTEHNRNIRTATFEILTKLAELERVVFLAQYDHDAASGSPRTGWTYVLVIRDLSAHRAAARAGSRCASCRKRGRRTGRAWARTTRLPSTASTMRSAHCAKHPWQRSSHCAERARAVEDEQARFAVRGVVHHALELEAEPLQDPDRTLVVRSGDRNDALAGRTARSRASGPRRPPRMRNPGRARAAASQSRSPRPGASRAAAVRTAPAPGRCPCAPPAYMQKPNCA